jgi:hypothetical protein
MPPGAAVTAWWYRLFRAETHGFVPHGDGSDVQPRGLTKLRFPDTGRFRAFDGVSRPTKPSRDPFEVRGNARQGSCDLWFTIKNKVVGWIRPDGNAPLGCPYCSACRSEMPTLQRQKVWRQCRVSRRGTPCEGSGAHGHTPMPVMCGRRSPGEDDRGNAKRPCSRSTGVEGRGHGRASERCVRRRSATAC